MLLIPYLLAAIPGALAAPEVLARPDMPATFTIGVGGTSLRLAQHTDGAVVMMASDGARSVTCAAYSPSMWALYRDYFASLIAFWPTAPHLRFPVADPGARAHAGEPGVCEVTAYTADYHLYVEVARLERDRRTDIVRVELSPIETTHDVVDVSSARRVEDNTFGVRLAQTASILVAGASGDPYDADGFVGALQRGIEDTSTYSVSVIGAHSDLSLFVLVLDAYRAGGALPDDSDVEAAYRIRRILATGDARGFSAVLAHLARGEPAAQVLIQVQHCGEDADLPVCLSTFAPAASP